MATQVQIRRAIAATQNTRTLTAGELDFDTTNNRLNVHNGSTAGGVNHVNCFDQQNSYFSYAGASGTNALTVTLPVAPSSYNTGQTFTFKTASSNTGSVTLNVNSLGAKTIKKIFDGAKSDLSSGDLISGQMVTVIYDGTDFQIVGGVPEVFAKQAWIPTGVSSYTAGSCQYIDYGDSVTLSFQVDGGSNIPSTITNVPFSPLEPVVFWSSCYRADSGTPREYVTHCILDGNTINVKSVLDLSTDFRNLLSPLSAIGQMSGVVTYIKG